MTKKDTALSILKEYSGDNPYILHIRNNVLIWNRNYMLTDFNIDFILKNHNRDIIPINRMVKVSEQWALEKKEEWGTEFIPYKIKVIALIGETDRHYCCMVRYRKSVPPIMTFIPKCMVITNFLVTDYHDMNVDFDRYDKLSTSKDPNRKLRPHQKDSVKFLLNRKKCILASEMGTGKSVCLSVAAIEGNFDSVLIICPASLKTNWKNELSWYVPEKDITIVDSIINKTKPELEEFLGYKAGKSGLKKDELIKEAKEKGKWSDNRFVIVNFDILDEFYKPSRAYTDKKLKELSDIYPLFKYIYNRKTLIIVDEAHKLSNKTSMRYKIVNDLIRKGNPDSVYLSTGTPVTNMPQNLFCLLQLLDDPIASDWQYFSERYCGAKQIYAPGEWNRLVPKYANRIKREGWKDMTPSEKDDCRKFLDRYARKIWVMNDATNIEELKEAISHIYFRVEKSDMGDLPDKTIHEVRYDLTEKQREEYNRLWDEYEAKKTEENPDVELYKDLLEGSIYRGYLADQMVPNTINLANTFIDKGEKVVIACCYDNELYALKEYYGDRCVIYNGKCSLKQKDEAINKFKTDDNVVVFIGNIIAAGVGITLIESHRLIFCSYDYVYANNSQMEDRVHRIGQTHKCDIYYQMFNDTHCQHMWDIVLKKQYVSNTLITKKIGG